MDTFSFILLIVVCNLSLLCAFSLTSSFVTTVNSFITASLYVTNNVFPSGYSCSIQILKNKCNTNNNKSFLIDDITDKDYKTKYMGFCKYKNNLIRRIDIRFVTFDYYYSALMYFTGSAEFNKKLRKIAKEKGYKLSEYGLTNLNNNEKIQINSENDIFNFLNLQYLKPKYR